MAKDMRKTSLEEMETFRANLLEKYPDEELYWKQNFFNNFPLNVMSWGRELHEEGGTLDDPSFTMNDRRASTFYRTRTLGQFYDEIDVTIQELGLDKYKIVRMFLEQQEKGNWSEWCDVVFDLYVRLREKGYNHYSDLTG